MGNLLKRKYFDLALHDLCTEEPRSVAPIIVRSAQRPGLGVGRLGSPFCVSDTGGWQEPPGVTIQRRY
jgi:hypothetical protein